MITCLRSRCDGVTARDPTVADEARDEQILSGHWRWIMSVARIQLKTRDIAGEIDAACDRGNHPCSAKQILQARQAVAADTAASSCLA